MPFMDGLNVIAAGRKKESDRRLWEQYLTVYPRMTEENFISFSDFKKDAYSPKEARKTKEDILKDVKHIIDLTVR